MNQTAVLVSTSIAFLCVAAVSMTPQKAPQPVLADLAASGRLRAAINFGNPVLSSKDPKTGEPRGVAVDLSRELARRLGVPLEIVPYTSAGKVVQDANTGMWDVAYVAIDPQRGAEMIQSPPYAVMEAFYLVGVDSDIHGNAEVDREGIRIAVGKGSAYDLLLSRELKHATLVRLPSSPEVVNAMIVQKLEAAAGVRQQLEADAKRVGGVRLLPSRFMVINQAIAVPKGHEAGAKYLREFVEEIKSSGFVADALARHHIESATVAPPGDPR